MIRTPARTGRFAVACMSAGLCHKSYRPQTCRRETRPAGPSGEPAGRDATFRLLDASGVDFTCVGEKENCCGTPMLVAGKWDVFVETIKKNIAAVKEAGADTVVTSCPACDMMWRYVYSEWAEKLGIEYDIKARHYSEILAEQIKKGDLISHPFFIYTRARSCQTS